MFRTTVLGGLYFIHVHTLAKKEEAICRSAPVMQCLFVQALANNHTGLEGDSQVTPAAHTHTHIGGLQKTSSRHAQWETRKKTP